ncbi:MAG TPA: hypothetical protein VHE55_07255 [Fimbriimonadaceae bacterium]|nr:hypothetical protein [Fimbriimonadaceae bacterium]
MSLRDPRHYLLPRPPYDPAPRTRRRLDEIIAKIRETSEVTLIDSDLLPKWQLLCYLAESGFLLHGSGNSAIEEFIPRQPTDANPFGAQNAVYAASDGIWPMFYAILDRDNFTFSLHNACLSFLDDRDEPSAPFYFFSIRESALEKKPFRDGYVYVLPRDTFSQDPQSELGGNRFKLAHWASLAPVRPLAVVAVRPEDFPFLDQIRGHDDHTLDARMKEDPARFPWVDEQWED